MTISAVLLLAWCTGLSLCFARDAATFDADSSEQLLSGLRNQSVTLLVVRSSISIALDEWSSYSQSSPLVIRRNLTIISSPPSLFLDFNFMKYKIRLNRGVTLTIQDLEIRHSRYGSGVNYLDFLAFSQGAVVKLVNVVYARTACIPTQQAIALIPDAARYPGYPGEQNATAIYDFQYCEDGVCFPEAITYNDVALVPPLTEDQVAGGYAVVMVNTTKACKTVVSEECLRRTSPDQCVADAIDSLVEIDTPGKVAARAQQHAQRQLLAVILGPLLACLGTFIIAGAAACVVLHRRRNNGRTAAGRQVLASEMAPRGGDHSSPEDDIGGGPKVSSDHPTSSSWEITVQRTAQHVSFANSSNSASGADSSSNKVQLGVLLGAGSFGRVYKGRWQGREVAVKVIRHSSKTADMVLNEVNLMLSFDHPNIVRALHVINWSHKPHPARSSTGWTPSHDQTTPSSPFSEPSSMQQDTGTGPGDSRSREQPDDAQTWIVQEYCNAGNMADMFIDKGPPQNDFQQLRLLCRLLEVAQALNHLHSRNVIHGDLKTANVLLTTCPSAPFGRRAKVTDFGISKVLQQGQTHRSTRTLGTVSHMSPELLRMGHLSAAADVYAFGIMMWELASGKMAFSNMHYGEVVERIALRGERPQIPDNVPEAYALLMSSCWVDAPGARPTFEQVVDCLQIMLASLQQQVAAGARAGESTERQEGEGLMSADNGPQDL